jgi:hypothetical protein
MLFKEIIAVYCENHIEHTMLVEYRGLDFKAGGTDSNHRDLDG